MIWNVVEATWLSYFQLKFKNGLYVQELLDAILLAIIKIPGHSKPDSTRNAVLKRNQQQSNLWYGQRDISSNDNVKKLASGVQQLASGKEKQNWKSDKFCFDIKKLWFRPDNSPDQPAALKFPLRTSAHALNHWPTDKTIASMHQY